MESLALDMTRAEAQMTLVVSGTIDLETVTKLEDAFRAARAQRPAVLRIDLAAVEFIDSTALNVFVRWHQEGARNGFHIVFAGATDGAERLFRMTRLDQLLTIEH